MTRSRFLSKSFYVCALLSFGVLTAAGANPNAAAHDYEVSDLRISHPYAHPTVSHMTPASAYFNIENIGHAHDKLIAVTSPAAKSVEIHTMDVGADNVMRMREIHHLDIAANNTVTMAPGKGYHLMLMGLNQPLKEGTSFPMTLTFEKAGKVNVSVSVDHPNKIAMEDHKNVH